MPWGLFAPSASVFHDVPLIHGATRGDLLRLRGGYGGGTIGGLFGAEVTVTNTNDTGAGSLRAACALTYPKWITFSPGLGGIRLQSKIDITGETTIDGRGTTPGDATAGTGFYIENYGFRCTGSNHIIHNVTIDFSQWWEGYNIYGAGLGVQPIQATGNPVNGEVYIASGPSLGRENFWYDHVTFNGVHYGTGTPPKSGTLWDFCDGGIAFGNKEQFITVSNCKFVDMNKAIILGFGSTTTTSFGDWASIHHNYFLRGIQRQPLSRFSHVHVYGNYYSEMGIPGQTRGETIDADDGTELIYEGNLAESSLLQANAFAFSRWEKGPTVPFLPAGAILGRNMGNVVLQNVRLDPDGALDGGTVSFSPPYPFVRPSLVTTGQRSKFRTLITTGAGAH